MYSSGFRLRSVVLLRSENPFLLKNLSNQLLLEIILIFVGQFSSPQLDSSPRNVYSLLTILHNPIFSLPVVLTCKKKRSILEKIDVWNLWMIQFRPTFFYRLRSAVPHWNCVDLIFIIYLFLNSLSEVCWIFSLSPIAYGVLNSQWQLS